MAWSIARDKGLTELTLRDVAERIGMRAPSLYSYFESKNAIYDAMFGQAWSDYLSLTDAVEETLPQAPRARLKAIARTFFDFAAADLPRYQLMNQRTVPGFEPSRESYEPAMIVLDKARAELTRLGVSDAGHADLFTALISGLVDAQLANDPGGDRWSRLLEDAMDMYAEHVALPEPDHKGAADE